MLAAGAGTRLWPLTSVTAKVLCPVAGTTLLDANVERVAAAVGAGCTHVAVNVHHRAEDVVAAVGGRAHVSIERGEAQGTAGGIAHLRPWVDGRAVLAVNGDTWTTIDLRPMVAGWDGTTVRVLVVGADELVPGVGILGSLLPPDVVANLPARPAGLYETAWRDAEAGGRLEVVRADGPFVPCDRPVDYLRANLLASGGESVVGEGAVVDGELVRSVVWPGGTVAAGERLVDAIRVGERLTVLIR